MSNTHLINRQKNGPSDEFPTNVGDIEKASRIHHLREHEIFKGQTVFCPCDDYRWSGFSLWFNAHFEELGLERLICRGYKEGGMGTLYERTKTKTWAGNAEGTGDFREPEAEELRNESDVIVTNPPFSLKRDVLRFVGDKNSLLIFPFVDVCIVPGMWKDNGWMVLNNTGYSYHFRKMETVVTITNIQELKTECRPLPEVNMKEHLATHTKHHWDDLLYVNIDGALSCPTVDSVPRREDWAGDIIAPISFTVRDLSDWEWHTIPTVEWQGRHLFKRIRMRRKENGNDEKVLDLLR